MEKDTVEANCIALLTHLMWMKGVIEKFHSCLNPETRRTIMEWVSSLPTNTCSRCQLIHDAFNITLELLRMEVECNMKDYVDHIRNNLIAIKYNAKRGLDRWRRGLQATWKRKGGRKRHGSRGASDVRLFELLRPRPTKGMVLSTDKKKRLADVLNRRNASGSAPAGPSSPAGAALEPIAEKSKRAAPVEVSNDEDTCSGLVFKRKRVGTAAEVSSATEGHPSSFREHPL
ncbi:hypothetical protein VNO80_01163 [Phaseolus coccineus]|uniref:Uncharacterized protein n=1 Tax=Phaseolus coccineus TaxID=3886 RepID=A0AAN9P3H0_PHACN